MTPKGNHAAKEKKTSIWRIAAIDLICICLGLLVFALFHHVIHFDQKTEPTLITPVTPTPVETAEPEPTPVTPEQSAEPEITPEPVKVYKGMWGEKFADKFTDGEVIVTENSYQSENVNITVTKYEGDRQIYYVADIYINDITCLRSGFANDKYDGGIVPLADMARDFGAVVGISGDHYYGRYEGIVVRNYYWYRETRFQDIGVLLSDGRLVTMTNAEIDMDNLKEAAPYQIWSFGPELLDEEGKAKTSFNSTVTVNNPRSAIGCVEPGHYYFVVVDGRINESRGMTMQELAQLFEDLGCVSAYNLDGGQSSGFVWQGELISYPYGRNVSDIIYIVDGAQEGDD